MIIVDFSGFVEEVGDDEITIRIRDRGGPEEIAVVKKNRIPHRWRSKIMVGIPIRWKIVRSKYKLSLVWWISTAVWRPEEIRALKENEV